MPSYVFFKDLSVDVKQTLLSRVDKLEINDALDLMAPLKALRIDEIHVKFFQSKWYIVGYEVYKMVSEAFEENKLDIRINKIVLILIPKVDEPETLTQFRPISL